MNFKSLLLLSIAALMMIGVSVFSSPANAVTTNYANAGEGTIASYTSVGYRHHHRRHHHPHSSASVVLHL